MTEIAAVRLHLWLERARGASIDRPWARRDVLRQQPYRILILTTTGVVGVLAVLSAAQLLAIVIANRYGIGVDFHQYQDHVTRWLATGQLYLPHQLDGPTSVMDGDPLYPPTILLLLLPFRVMPEIVWWIVPLAILGVALVRLRPAPWTWPILALIALWPRTPALIYYGNPGMWIDAFIALALWQPWAGPLVLLKPSLAPFALLGGGRRSWWVSLVALAVVSAAFGGLWLDYVRVLVNSHVPLSYSLLDLPLALAPVVAWLGRPRPS